MDLGIKGRKALLYLCSAQAGFISGQNLQLDGGSYAGVI
jgi:3-oxoacyl-[acyl-carrier protein] reductase